ERPYERPPLTKDYLRGESEREKAYVHPDGFYAQQGIELETGVTVTGIEPRASRVTLDDGRVLGYDRLLLATGAQPRRLHIPGADLDRVCYLRTLADCDQLRARLDAGGRAAVIGAGWIGSEFAASARQRGLEVTVIDPQPLPHERIFGRDVAAFYHDVHAKHGIEFLLARGEEVRGGRGGGGVRGQRRGQPGADGQWPPGRVRLRRRRHRCGAAHRAGRRRGPGGQQRRRHPREPPDLRAGHLRGGRRSERVA